MSIPNEWEHLQRVVREVQNRRVREQFSDLDNDDDDISTPRSSLRAACLLKDSDSAPMTLIRLWLHEITLGGATSLHPPLYTMPTDRYQQEVKFAPQVTLYFREDLEDVEEGYKPIDAELSFRLMQESPQTFTQTDALVIAQRIRSEFCTGAVYRWRKGRVKLSYRDKERGYQFSVNAFNEMEGKEVIRKVLSLQNHTLSNEALTVSQMAETPPIVPPTQVIYGQSRRLPRKRPVGWVRFRYAECHVWGINKPITLVDTTLRRQNPLLRAG